MKKRTEKKLLTWLLAAVMAVAMLFGSVGMTAVPVYAAEGDVSAVTVWDGTADTSWYNTTDKEFTITTPAQLAGLAQIVNHAADGIAIDDFAGKTVRLGADIYLNNTDSPKANEWDSIGKSVLISGDGTAGSVYEDTSFAGVFDGQGHYIYNIYTNHLSDQGERGDLFGTNEGTIMNLGVTGEVNSYRYAAGVVGVNYGTVEYCYTKCDITANGGGGSRGSGGVVGTNYGVVQYCWSESNVYNGYRAAGGIVGNNASGSESAGMIIGCWFTGYADSAANECKGAIAGASDSANGAMVYDSYFLTNSSGKIVRTSGTGSEYNGLSIGIGSYNTTWDQTGTYEFDSAGALISDSGKTVTSSLTALSGAVVAGDAYYPVLYWQKQTVVPSTVNVTVEQPAIGGMVTVSNSGAVAWGSNLTISYDLADGYKFTGYVVNGEVTDNNWVNVTKDTTISIMVEEIRGNALTLLGNDTVILKAYDANGSEIKSGEAVPELTTVTVKASLADDAIPEDYAFEYSGSVRFLLNEVAKPSATGWATEFSFTMPDEAQEVSVAAVQEVRKEWISLADTSWYDPEKSTFTITTAEQLAGLSKLVMDGNNLYGKTFTLGADIDLSNPDGTGAYRNWTPIGGRTTCYIPIPEGEITDTASFAAAKIKWGATSIYTYDSETGTYKTTSAYNEDIATYYVQSAFAGTFDGNGHEVTNLYINTDGYVAWTSRCGLFGEAVNATIKDLTVRGEISRTLNPGPTGGILAYMRANLLIENCRNYVTINATGTQYIGGIAGGVQTTNPSGISIKNCTNYADLSNNGNLGGIAGQLNTGSASGLARCVVEDCMNYGNLTTTTGGYAGGIAGNICRVTVSRCGNEADISCQTGNNGVGGVVGYTASASAAIPTTVEECYNYGKVISTGNDTTRGNAKLGGIIGSASASTDVFYCYNSGTIEGQSVATTGTQRGVGGIVGYSSCNSWKNSYNRGTVSNENADDETIDKTIAGGLIGNNLNKAYVPYGYWLDTSCWNGYGYGKWTDASADENGNRGDLSNIISKTAEEMKSAEFLETLGAATYDAETGAWSNASGSYKAAVTLNEQYPILWWQDDEAAYHVETAEAEHGTVTTDVPLAKAGETITVKAVPAFAYQVKSVGYYTTDPESVTLLEETDGTYSFVMPESDVTVVALFEVESEVVLTVFGTDLTMADLLAYPTIKDYSGVGGEKITIGITFADLFEHYSPLPEGTTGVVFNNPEEDEWLQTRAFTTEALDNYMLAWQEGSTSYKENGKVRLIAAGTGKNNWMNGVRNITVCEHTYSDHKCTVCGAQEAAVLTYVDGSDTYRIYEEDIEAAQDTEESTKTNAKGKAYTAKFTKVTKLLENAGIEKLDAACGYVFAASDFSAAVATADIDNMYIFKDGDSYRSAWDGAAGSYWVSGLQTITATSAHTFNDDHVCSVCKTEEKLVLTYNRGDEAIEIYESDVAAVADAEETTKTNANGKEYTAVFTKVTTLLNSKGVTSFDATCGYKFAAGDGFNAIVPTANIENMYIFEDGGSLRSAYENGPGRYWVSGLSIISAMDEHSFAVNESDTTKHTCAVCGLTEDHTITLIPASDATCTEDGCKEHYACSGCKTCYADEAGTTTLPEEEVVIKAIGHDWGDASYEWSEDNSTVTATRICNRDDSHTETETAETTSEVTKEATYETEGELTYTAEFENAAFAAQTKTEVIDKLEKASIAGAEISGISDMVYTGEEITQNAEISVDGTVLTEKTDYEVSYSDNTKVGLASVTFTGTGIYKDSIDASFRILFTDVADPEAFWYDYVYWLTDKGITTGWDDGTFRPNNNINRAAVVTFLWRYAGCPEPDAIADFSDMPEDTDKNQDFRMAISWAAENGITTGYDDGTFRPWAECNRAAIVTFLWRYAGQPVAAEAAGFKDMTGNSDFDSAISWAAENGITTGWAEDNTFRPWNQCKRLAVASFLSRYDEILTED